MNNGSGRPHSLGKGSMNKNIPFVKYTSYGNNFVIIDETVAQILTEDEKSNFAYQATNTFFGIGCDNLLIAQRCTGQTLQTINKARRYWSETPDASEADFVFRMFEPNGEEAFSCGNGLMAIASYLYQRYGIESARIMTELPFASPRIISFGTQPEEGVSWANTGRIRRVPLDVASQAIRRPINECIDAVDNISIKFRSYDLRAYSERPSLEMCGYLVFTGEPHLVVFPQDSFSDPELAKPLFLLTPSEEAESRVHRRLSVGSWLVRRIGVFLNDQLREHFPAGINVNFACVDSERQVVEYRCFERGIDRETLACGTGAVAVAAVSKHLGYVRGRMITVLPHLCRWHDRDATMHIIQDRNGEWRLVGTPKMLVEGAFSFETDVEGESSSERRSSTCDVLALEQQLLTNRAAAAGG
jgi:diaminopimelate epimerase